ncbi:MAG: hypothetical protein CME24_21030, partial [Gemmatimonadetes bacterium]|nr:hypothetical protein [Gemmatimonadota bacterium]
MVATETSSIPLPTHVLAVPLSEPVPFPTQQLRPLTVTDPVLARVLETKLASGERLAVLVDDAALAHEDPTSESVGVLSAVHQALRTPDQHLQILIRPLQRVRVEDL